MNAVEPRQILSGGRTIEREIVIAAPAERVFRALTEPGELERWFTTTATGEARAGGSFRFFWEGDGHVDGRYLEVVPPERLVYEWYNPQGTVRITIVLEAEAAGTHLRLTAEGYGDGEDWDALYDGERNGWGPLLGALQKWVVTGEATTWAPGGDS
jgi:uncharacterized protein YndB with AHSA1/START domain